MGERPTCFYFFLESLVLFVLNSLLLFYSRSLSFSSSLSINWEYLICPWCWLSTGLNSSRGLSIFVYCLNLLTFIFSKYWLRLIDTVGSGISSIFEIVSSSFFYSSKGVWLFIVFPGTIWTWLLAFSAFLSASSFISFFSIFYLPIWLYLWKPMMFWTAWLALFSFVFCAMLAA